MITIFYKWLKRYSLQINSPKCYFHLKDEHFGVLWLLGEYTSSLSYEPRVFLLMCVIIFLFLSFKERIKKENDWWWAWALMDSFPVSSQGNEPSIRICSRSLTVNRRSYSQGNSGTILSEKKIVIVPHDPWRSPLLTDSRFPASRRRKKRMLAGKSSSIITC